MTDKHPDFSAMTEGEIADWQYAHRDELDTAVDGDDYEVVEAAPVKEVATVTSFRMPPGELEQIREAAASEALSLSEWIRGSVQGRPSGNPRPCRTAPTSSSCSASCGARLTKPSRA